LSFARAGQKDLLWELLKGRFRTNANRKIRRPELADNVEDLVNCYCDMAKSGPASRAHLNGPGLMTLLDALLDDNEDLKRSILAEFSGELAVFIKDKGTVDRLSQLGVIVPDHSLISPLLFAPEKFMAADVQTLDIFIETRAGVTSILWRQLFRTLSHVLGYNHGRPAISSRPARCDQSRAARKQISGTFRTRETASAPRGGPQAPRHRNPLSG